MDIVIASSEVAPFSKSGGMGDVTAALAAGLHRAGHRVITVSPRYGGIDPATLEPTGIEVRAHLGDSVQRATLSRKSAEDGPTHILVEHPMFAGRAGLYGDKNGSFGDNHIRFTLLQRAACEAARKLTIDGKPFGPDPLFHVHDWQTASLPVWLDQIYRPLGFFQRSAVVLTLHNPAHQGRLPAALFDDIDLPPRWFSPHGMEWHGDLGLLKCGIVRADRLTTVSPTFAWEMTTAQGGFGLDGLFRGRFADLTGILNGIDMTVWDPANDPHLDAPFSATDFAGKAVCKAALQAELELPMQTDTPLIGSVGRLDPQKGVELLIDSIPWMVEQGAQVVVLGSAAAAHKHYETELQALENRFPESVRVWIGFSERMAHRIEAGSDLFAMPSLFEPCGLNQMYSQRYGALPVVRRTGGLADSVREGETGFLFEGTTGFAFRGALHRALKQYAADGLAAMRAEAMALDLGWDAVVPQYEKVFEEAVNSRARLLALES